MREAACRDWIVEGAAREYKRDLTDWQKTSNWIAETDGFDLIVMAHGVQKTATMKDVDEELWMNIIGNNLNASASLTHALLEHDKVNDGALIVYFSSIQATQPREGRGLYGISKAGVEALARVVAVENPNIRTIALRLGQMTKAMRGIDFSDFQAQEIEKKTIRPWVDAQSVAKIIFNLYDNGMSMTGETVEISSGHKFSVWPK